MTNDVSVLPFTHGKHLGDLEVLARSPLLRSLRIQDLSQLFELLDQVALPSGTCVFREGDTADLMYFVLEGEARLRRGALELRPLRPGDSFGEAALLVASPRSFTVETHGTVRLARLSRSRHLSFVTAHPRGALHLTQALAALLAQQVVDLTDDVGLIAHQRSAPRHTHVRVRRGNDTLVVPTGTLVGAMLPRNDADTGAPVVGAHVNHRAASLEHPLVAGASVAAATPVTADGRVIVLRSMALVVLEAARRVAPDDPLRMGPTIDVGQIAIVPDSGVDRVALARWLGARIDALRTEDIALREEVWSTDEARVYFTDHGAPDVTALLLARRESTVTLASCGETVTLGMGPLLPRSSLIGSIVVEPHPRGLLVSLPELTRYMPIEHGARVDPIACERRAARYDGPMAASEQLWVEGLGVTSAGTYSTSCLGHRVPDGLRLGARL